ncbi:IS21 family transposase [Bacillus cereus group sp. TH153LC]|uniref:IS21 family transposase n=1 Tax=Bacillus cereus group sp. TH153LC TaxID=3018059 RepID=UPI0022E7A40A|nr:IS21 family transposase [Bacillus cereus group sp. TH153LC]MDA1663406.1 IS21 family transposase [Bacillus cereus group sp. TH153LC]
MFQIHKTLKMSFEGFSQRTIAASTGHGRKTISKIIGRAKEKEIAELTEEMTDEWLNQYLFPERSTIEKGYFMPNWEYIHKELMRKNVTLTLLHKEYDYQARINNKIPYSYRTFCEKYQGYASKYKFTMPIKRKPGEIIEVDWAGSTLHICDRNTGENITAYVFVATLPYSQLSYVEAFFDMKSPNWITAHIHAFEYFDGVAQTLVPDNLKTGVIFHKKFEPILNQSYREMADYYNTVIVPARVKSPKDKGSVEGSVGYISRQIIAALRNIQCFSLEELNEAIIEKVNELNGMPFQKRPGSRRSIYNEEEKSFMSPLPAKAYRPAEWRVAKVQKNYHVQIEYINYSVPFEYLQKEVDVRLTKELVEIYYKEMRIASHKRIHGVQGQYSTNPNHMPDSHREYFNHTPESMRKWAEEIGHYTTLLINHILKNNVEKQALNQLMALKNIRKNTSAVAIEEACKTVLSVSIAPNIQLLKEVIKRQKEMNQRNTTSYLNEEATQDYGFTRGAKYFGGLNNVK